MSSDDLHPFLKWPDLLERERPSPTARIDYGPERLQRVDVWVPEGTGPFRTVLMVHGGCWQSEIADRRIMNWVAEDLRLRGIAVWNIDYRGVDRDGGGYPGTFLDTAAAADSLRAHSARFGLDVSKVVAVGHSAGGHLASWLAARPRIAGTSPLRTADPLPIAVVISLGGLPDLEEAARPPGSGCGVEVIHRLTGGSFSDTSVPALAPLGIPQLLINGLQDRIVPPRLGEDYVRKMQAAGDDIRLRLLDQTGHIELIAPESDAWAAATDEIRRAFGGGE